MLFKSSVPSGSDSRSVPWNSGSPGGQHRQIVEIPFRHTGVRHHLALLARERNNPSKPHGTVLLPWPLKHALLAQLVSRSTTDQVYACQNQSGNSSFSILNSGIDMSIYRAQGSLCLYTQLRDPFVSILDSGIHMSLYWSQGSMLFFSFCFL